MYQLDPGCHSLTHCHLIPTTCRPVPSFCFGAAASLYEQMIAADRLHAVSVLYVGRR